MEAREYGALVPGSERVRQHAREIQAGFKFIIPAKSHIQN